MERIEIRARRAAARAKRNEDAELSAAGAALRHIDAARTALRSGRVPELEAEAIAAADAAPQSIPRLVFQAGSVLQGAYRFTGKSALRVRALSTLGVVADCEASPMLAVQARALMGNVHMLNGAFHRALEHCDAALALAKSAGLANDAATAMAHQFRAYVLLEWNQLDAAEASLAEAWALTTPSAAGVRTGVARVMARIRDLRGDRAGMEEWLRQLELAMPEPLTLRNREWLSAVRTRMVSGPADVRAIEDWLRTWNYRTRTSPAPDAADILARLHEYDHALDLLEATNRWPRILKLAPIIAEAAGAERAWFAARAAAAEAAALEAAGRANAADARMRDALTFGEEGSFVRAYIGGSPLRRVILRRVKAAGIAGAAEARRVLQSSRVSASAAPSLTPTQRTILKRVSAGGSNEAIARDLGISVSTVKTHLRAVNERLKVSSRTQAVARARKLRLISDR